MAGEDLFDSVPNEQTVWQRTADPYEGDNPAKDMPYMGRQGIDNGVWSNVIKPTAYEYGGRRGGAESEENRYAGLAAAADARKGPSVYSADYKGDRTMDSWDRNSQYQANELQRQAALGNAPSAAQIQMQQGLGQAVQQQASLAAGARGGGANLAAAQQVAAAQGANMSGNAIQSMGALRAQEMANARGAYMAGTNQIRGADQGRMQQSGQMGIAQGQADIATRGQNDARNLGYEGFRRGVFQDQLGAQGAGEAANAGVYQSNADRAQRASDHSDAERDKYIGAATSAGGALLMASDMSLKKNVQPANGLAGAAVAGAASQAAARSLGGTEPITFDYKEGGGHRVLGTSANALEKTPYGSQVVQKTPDGKRAINVPGATSMLLAAGADQEHRLRALESGTTQPNVVGTYGGKPIYDYNGHQSMVAPPAVVPLTAPPPEFIYPDGEGPGLTGAREMQASLSPRGGR